MALAENGQIKQGTASIRPIGLGEEKTMAIEKTRFCRRMKLCLPLRKVKVCVCVGGGGGEGIKRESGGDGREKNRYGEQFIVPVVIFSSFAKRLMF